RFIIKLIGQPERGKRINYLIETMKYNYTSRKLDAKTIGQSVRDRLPFEASLCSWRNKRTKRSQGLGVKIHENR
ncbi:MAG: hypothetical protein KAI29_24760, partial [Cyclobacteriaceae bacterium]|nr:hypothetical protein [Cyclobacteriaceae bacterium]